MLDSTFDKPYFKDNRSNYEIACEVLKSTLISNDHI